MCVDRERLAAPVSGTAVRSDPLGQWEHLPAGVRPCYVKRIAVVGPESVGKTTLTERIADELTTTWVPEFGRAYTDGRDARTLDLADFEAIARAQMAWEAAAAPRANRILVCDTELHTTCTSSVLILGDRPVWLTEVARARPYDLFLVLQDDVPWVDDGTRVLGERRRVHLRRLERERGAAGRRMVSIGGDHGERLEAALRAIRAATRWPRTAADPDRQGPGAMTAGGPVGDRLVLFEPADCARNRSGRSCEAIDRALFSMQWRSRLRVITALESRRLIAHRLDRAECLD